MKISRKLRNIIIYDGFFVFDFTLRYRRIDLRKVSGLDEGEEKLKDNGRRRVNEDR